VNSKAYFEKYKEQLILGLFLVYLVILGLGVIGELFKIQWILNLPLFKL
jgi:hypothetical protein